MQRLRRIRLGGRTHSCELRGARRLSLRGEDRFARAKHSGARRLLTHEACQRVEAAAMTSGKELRRGTLRSRLRGLVAYEGTCVTHRRRLLWWDAGRWSLECPREHASEAESASRRRKTGVQRESLWWGTSIAAQPRHVN